MCWTQSSYSFRQSKEQLAQHWSHPSVTRYFDHIQTLPQVRSAAGSLSPPLPLVAFDLENAPKPTRTAEPPKKKEKAAKAASEAAAPVQAAADAPPAPAGATGKQEGNKVKKEPKEKKEAAGADAGGKRASGKSAPAAIEPTAPVPSMIDLRVGHIIDGAPPVSLSYQC
jgi:aminoacyl tRNA synthase complex-interacting multifunctional protein 1